MPTPDEQTEYIEISDFSPGIHSDQHCSTPPRFTAADTTTGVLFGNGAARVSGTERCHADKTGALVPLPKAQPAGARDHIFPALPLQDDRPFRYVLDAQIGSVLVDATEIASTPFPEASRQTMQIMWGFFVIP